MMIYPNPNLYYFVIMPFLKTKREFRPWWRDATEKVIRNGFRVATFGKTIKDKYTGEFKNDKKHGKGVQYYENGTFYEGDWADGTRQGHGVLSNDCGHDMHSRIYTGMWENDQPHGFGLKQYDDGKLYKGLFYRGYRHGHGCMYYPNGSIYMGNWIEGHRSGVGRIIQSDSKNYYEGIFQKGMKYGRGKYHHVSTGQIQDGVWEDGIGKVSIMWDDKRSRPIAKNMTKFPIPRLYLDQPMIIFTDQATPIYERNRICAY